MQVLLISVFIRGFAGFAGCAGLTGSVVDEGGPSARDCGMV